MTANPLLALAEKWKAEANNLRVLAGKAQKLGDLNDADVRFGAAQDADAYAAELEKALAAAHEGMVLVPVVPTYQMAEAMGLKWESDDGFPWRYAAMIAAATRGGG